MTRIMFDMDGSICSCNNEKLNKISKIIAYEKIPWQLILIGLLLTNQKVDKEMIEILNSPFNESFITTARPKELKKYTVKFLQKNGAIIKEENITFLGTGKDIVSRKVAKALEKRVVLVVDDDEQVLKASAKSGITGCSPRVFKGLCNSGVIK